MRKLSASIFISVLTGQHSEETSQHPLVRQFEKQVGLSEVRAVLIIEKQRDL